MSGLREALARLASFFRRSARDREFDEEVLRLVLKQGLRPSVAGLAIGLAAALAVTPVLTPVLVQVSPTDPTAFAVAAVALLCAALLGCLIPARRAMRVDPLVALRHD